MSLNRPTTTPPLLCFVWGARPLGRVTVDEATPLTVRLVGMEDPGGTEIRFRFELIDVDDGTVVSRLEKDIPVDADGNSTPLELLSKAPDKPGVFEIRCNVTPAQSKLWPKFSGGPTKADIRLPLLVSKVSGEADRDQGLTETEPELLGRASSFDPDSWRATSWIPENASRLVPKVRVKEIVREPWNAFSKEKESEDEHENLCSIEPGSQSVVKLPKMTAHERHLISIVISAGNGFSPVGQIELAETPEFNRVSRKEAFSVVPRLAGDTVEDKRIEFTHYPGAETQFVRVTSPASSKEKLQIVSIEVLSASESPRRPTIDHEKTRSATLVITSPDWARTMTRDYDLSNRGFAEPTIALYRTWKSVSRIAQDARWLGIDSISTPNTYR